jgi:phospholipase C
MPAVSILKAPANGDGHAGYSDPLLEQAFLVKTINAIMKSPFWSSTAIVINYDDADGWYDHQMSPIINSSDVNQPNLQYNDELNLAADRATFCGHGTPLKVHLGRVHGWFRPHDRQPERNDRLQAVEPGVGSQWRARRRLHPPPRLVCPWR